MISVAEALDRALALVAPLPSETVALQDAAGRVLAAPVMARLRQPPFAASAMDGYAVAGDPMPGTVLAVIGAAAAGKRFDGAVSAGQAVRIFTGAPVPDGATRVVLQEDVTASDGTITLTRGAAGPSNIRAAGQDFDLGAAFAPRVLRPADLALLAAMNHARLPVTRRPVVAIMATGDELVMPGADPGPDQIISSNGFALKAMVEAAGGAVRLMPIAADTEASLRTVFGLTTGADLIVTIGGASVGDHDLVGRVAESLGMTRAFWKIAMRPGKPLMAGRLGSGTPLLGLPGNPVSAIVCGHLFLLPMIRRMLGMAEVSPATYKARLAADLAGGGPRAHYLRARLSRTPDGSASIAPMADQDSALLSVLTAADALLIQPADAPPMPAGTLVDYLPI
ncbi:MAG: gephyrin-like molybdotransferase Glp [Pseudomonadota bacterium]